MTNVSDEQAPDQRLGRPSGRVLFTVRTPQPAQSILLNSWPLILGVLAASYVFATFFPALGGLLLIGTPLAVIIALAVGVWRARNITLTVTDEVIKVSSGKDGIACDRAEVQVAVLVESLQRRRLGPRTPNLILLDRDGRTALLLTGVLWPPAVLDKVIDLIAPVPLERVEGKQSPASLAQRYPQILRNTDGTGSR